MKTYKIILIPISVISISISCNKDNSHVNNLDKIIVGDNNNMIIHSMDTLIHYGAPHKVYSIELDSDVDGVKDYKITSYVNVSPGGVGDASEFKIESLRDFSFINVINIFDTTYFSRLYDTNNVNNHTAVLINDYYSCSKQGLNDSIISIDENAYIKPIRQWDTLSVDDIWTSKTLRIKDWYMNTYYDIISDNSDTIVLHYYTYTFNCHQFYKDGVAYIGIKIDNPKRQRLGWLKLSISDKQNVSLVEIAIQK